MLYKFLLVNEHDSLDLLNWFFITDTRNSLEYAWLHFTRKWNTAILYNSNYIYLVNNIKQCNRKKWELKAKNKMALKNL